MRILIIKLSSIGDVVHTLPALKALHDGLSGRGTRPHIDWLVEEAASGMLSGHPLIDEVIVVRNRGWQKSPGHNIALARRLAAKKYDVAMDFQGLLKSGIWVLLSGAKRKVGFSNARELSHAFLNEKLSPYDPDMHAVDRYLVLARHVAGGDVTEAAFTLAADAEAGRRALSKLREAGVPEGAGYFIVAPRARWATKLWDDGKFAALSRVLSERTGLWAVLAGGAFDREALEGIRAMSGEKAVSIAGLVDLKEFASIARGARLAVTVDSGPMHIAAAAGCPVVAVFGPTAPWRTGPYGKGHAVVRKDIQCSPCFKRECADPVCMKEISVDDVLAAALKILDGKGR